MFVFPALWVVYRPAIRVAPLAIGALLVFVVWFPFLRFESTRDFVDIKTLVSRQSMQPINYQASWCTPVLALRSEGESASAPKALPQLVSAGAAEAASSLVQPRSGGVTAFIRARTITLRDALVFNFDQMTRTPLAAIPLVLLALTTLAAIVLQAVSGTVTKGWNPAAWLRRAAWALLAVPLVFNEFVVARFLSEGGTLDSSTVVAIRELQAALLLGAVSLLVWGRTIADLLRRLVAAQREGSAAVSHLKSRVLALAVVVAWASLAMLAEPREWVRYFWIAPAQMLLVGAATTFVPEQFRWRRSLKVAMPIALTAALLSHPWLTRPLESWGNQGWSGPTPPSIQALDYLAAVVHSHGNDNVAIGYAINFAKFMPAMNIIDSRYKVGGEFDFYLRQRHRISNSNRCAEGVSATDEYRIVQVAAHERRPEVSPESWSPLGGEVKELALPDSFDIPPAPMFRRLRTFGDFQVFERIASDGDLHTARLGLSP